MGVFYRPPGLSSTMGPLPFTILQKVKKFYKPDHPTIPHHLLMDLPWFDLLSLSSPSIPTVPYGPYCSCTVPTTHTLPSGYALPWHTLDQYATHLWHTLVYVVCRLAWCHTRYALGGHGSDDLLSSGLRQEANWHSKNIVGEGHYQSLPSPTDPYLLLCSRCETVWCIRFGHTMHYHGLPKITNPCRLRSIRL